MKSRKGMRSIKKGPELWPFSFHDALEVASREGQATVGVFDSPEAARASEREMRGLWKRLPETPLHRSARLLEQYSFRNQVEEVEIGVWVHRIVRSPSKVISIRY